MQELSAKIYSVLSAIVLFVAIALRVFAVVFSLSVNANILFYVLIAISIGLVALEFKDSGELLNAFDFQNHSHLNIFSYIASMGFFINFVHGCLMVFYSIENGEYQRLTFFIPLCFVCFFALLSCFYFFSVGMSYSDRGYDFRKFKIFHLSPIIWSIFNVTVIMNEAISLINDAELVIKCVAFLFSAIFFYLFARETENANGAKKSMAFFAKSFTYLAIVYFANSLMLSQQKGNYSIYEIAFASSVLMISFFACSLKRNITKGV